MRRTLAGLPCEFKFRCAMNFDHPDESVRIEISYVSAAFPPRNESVNVPS